MNVGWRERERRAVAAARTRLGWTCAAFAALAIGGFLVASLTALVAGAIGATAAIGRLHGLRAEERLLRE